MATQLTDDNFLAALGGVMDPEIGRDLVSLGRVTTVRIDGGVVELTVEGDEAIHAILDVMSAGKPYQTLTHTKHNHPTVSELIPTVLGELK